QRFRAKSRDVKPDFQEQARRVGRAACHGGGQGEPQRGQIQLVHKLPQETGRVVGACPIFQRGGKEKLLTGIKGDGLCHASQTPTAAIHSKIAGVLRQSRQVCPNPTPAGAAMLTGRTNATGRERAQVTGRGFFQVSFPAPLSSAISLTSAHQSMFSVRPSKVATCR